MSLLGISKKGKWIIGGVCAFAVVATATTGLAAWVIGQNSNLPVEGGNITVEQGLNNTTITLESTSTAADLTVNFAPKAGTYPVVNASTEKGVKLEKLDFTIKGKYTKADESGQIAKVGAVLELSDAAVSLVTGGYIVAPGKLVSGTTNQYTLAPMTVTPDSETSLTGTFTSVGSENKSVYAFSWGVKFGNKNPCDYYDNLGGRDYSAAKTALETLRDFEVSGETSFKVILSTIASAE